MDKNNLTVFEFNEPSASSDEGKARRWVTLPMEPATPKEWESLFGKKKLAEIELLQTLAQHHEEFHDKMNSMMIHQLNCLQEKTQQSVQNFRQELSKAYNVELLKLQMEIEILKKKLETLELNAQTSC